MDTVTISETPAEGQEQTAPKFKSLAEATEKYIELEASSQSLLNDAEQKHASLAAQLAEAEEKFGGLAEELGKAQVEAANLHEQVEKLEAEAEASEKKAAKMAAEVGIEPVQVAGNEAEQPDNKTFLQRYNAIENPREKTEFFQKYEKEILSGR